MGEAPKKEERWSRAAGLVLLLVLMLWGGYWLWQAGPIPTPPLPAKPEQSELLSFARALVVGSSGAAAPTLADREDVRGAIVTLYFPGTPYAPLSAWADVERGNVVAAVETAARDAGGAWRERGRFGAGAERVRIDLTGRERAVRVRGDALERVIDPGIDGLVLRHAGRVFFASPSQWVETRASIERIAASLRKSAGTEDGLRRFRAASFIEGPTDPLTIVRGNVLPPYPPDAAALREASARGGAYLARMLDPRGRFVYLFDAQEAKSIGGYNLLRHAGTLWSMFQVHRATGDPTVRAAAERGLAYLGREFAWTDPRHPRAVFLREGGEGRPKTGDIKLGACGLGILAFVEAERAGVVLTPEQAALVVGLGEGVLAMQKPDGELRSYHAPPNGTANPRRSVYYPGEAILGLMELHARDGDARWLEAARRAADFQIDRRWRIGPLQVQVPPDAWLTQALEKLWLATKDDRYAAYAYTVADELVRLNLPARGPVPPDLIGATFNGRITRVTPTSSRNEAIVAAARLARVRGDSRRERRYLEAAVAGAWFGIAQQFRPENVHFVRSPAAALGGIRESVVDNEVRIDGVQHAVSGFLGLAELLEPRPAVAGTSGGPS